MLLVIQSTLEMGLTHMIGPPSHVEEGAKLGTNLSNKFNRSEKQNAPGESCTPLKNRAVE
jgi:hypothetical protein